MDRSPIATSQTIHPARPLRLEGAAGSRLTVLHGKAWITQDRDPRDRLLASGEDLVLDRNGLVLVAALEEEAQVTVVAPAAGPARQARTLWSRLQAARRDALARATLRAMTDRELQDIGLCRSQVELVGR